MTDESFFADSLMASSADTVSANSSTSFDGVEGGVFSGHVGAEEIPDTSTVSTASCLRLIPEIKDFSVCGCSLCV